MIVGQDFLLNTFLSQNICPCFPTKIHFLKFQDNVALCTKKRFADLFCSNCNGFLIYTFSTHMGRSHLKNLLFGCATQISIKKLSFSN